MNAPVRFLVRSPRFPDAVVPARDAAHARELVAAYRETTRHHRAQAAWEYGVHVPGVPNSYVRLGP